MTIKHALRLGGAAAALALLPINSASAGIPVIDPTAIAKITNEVSVATRSLSQVTQITNQVTGMSRSIGSGNISGMTSILGRVGLNFNDGGLLRNVTQLTGQVSNMSSMASSLPKVVGETNFSLPKISSFSDATSAAGELFYYNGSQPMTLEIVNSLRERREAVVRNAAITSYGVANSLKGEIQTTSDTASKLSDQAKSATDLRGDVQANTATLLAIYAEVTKQTALQAQMLDMQASQVLAVDTTGKR